MPNFDGGHYFLTALAPIDNQGVVEHGGFKSSPIHMVRDELERLPTALQSVATEEIGIQSPFARSARTHLARLVVIDAPFYNGRDPADSIISAAKNTDLLAPQPVDQLACPYLLFAADFDPMGDEPRDYLEELWSLARAELTAVFQYCYGFDAVSDASSFATFIIARQVETTMPFNDYWTTAPPFPSLPLWTLAIAPAVAVILAGAIGTIASSLWAGLFCCLFFLGVALFADYLIIMEVGGKPFPTAPDSSLRHVLKALYLQQAFTRFVSDQQGAPPEVLQKAFNEFVQRHDPANLDAPTQPPGVVRTKISEVSANA
jgi:hypothetical protein